MLTAVHAVAMEFKNCEISFIIIIFIIIITGIFKVA